MKRDFTTKVILSGKSLNLDKQHQFYQVPLYQASKLPQMLRD